MPTRPQARRAQRPTRAGAPVKEEIPTQMEMPRFTDHRGVVFGFLGLVICSEFPAGAVRAEVAFWSAVAICVVCFSRMFLSLRYLSDVVPGVCVGSLWLLIGIALNEWQKTGRRYPHAYQHHRHK